MSRISVVTVKKEFTYVQTQQQLTLRPYSCKLQPVPRFTYFSYCSGIPLVPNQGSTKPVAVNFWHVYNCIHVIYLLKNKMPQRRAEVSIPQRTRYAVRTFKVRCKAACRLSNIICFLTFPKIIPLLLFLPM
jgi:hypothetical protein